MGICKTFIDVINRSKKRGYEYIYTVIDIHGTIFKPSYSKYDNYEYYPFAKKVLRMLYKDPMYKIILWSSCYNDAFLKYNNKLWDDGIGIDFFNENPNEKNTNISCFDEKFYMSVGFDDKFGFNPYIDWFIIYIILKYRSFKAHIRTITNK